MEEQLIPLLRDLLEQHPEGLAEHALLKRLQSELRSGFPDTLFRDELALFRAHFLLFHALYRLRLSLLSEQRAVLQVDPRCIRLMPYHDGEGSQLADHDPLADYYMDLGNLEDTTPDDLARMLGAFWTRFYADGRREEALATLGLGADADLDSAQRRYRELAMLHHPDRGGETARFHAIREAIEILRNCSE